jgi:lipoate-protein ligase A
MRESEWNLLVDLARPTAEQMALDERLARQGSAAARFFTWSRTALSLGFKQPVPAWAAALRDAAHGVDVVERPTGGGMAFHGTDLSVAVVVPHAWSLGAGEALGAVCRSIAWLCESAGLEAVARLDAPAEGRVTYCLLETSPYAVTISDRKVGGFALRRYPESWLIQGSLLVRPLPQAFLDRLPVPVRAALADRAASLSEFAPEVLAERALARDWAKAWVSMWERAVEPAVELCVR